MKQLLHLLIMIFLTTHTFAQSGFLTNQKKYARVRTAIQEKEEIIAKKLKNSGIKTNDLNILIIAYKSEGELQIFAKRKTEQTYKKLAAYKICVKSGHLGPKRKQGDYQVPEGFYFIDRFNPASSYYLSLGINYPNLSDRKKSKAKNLGGDIFIHGECVTIGCLPMTNDKIKEIYLYAVHARNNGQQKIPVYIFPFKMTDRNFTKYKKKYQHNSELIGFWTNLKKGYDKFHQNSKALKISYASNGDYCF